MAKTIEDIKDANKRGALHFAAIEGKTEVCNYLLEELKLDVNVRDEDGNPLCSNYTVTFLAILLFFFFYLTMQLPECFRL